MPKIILKTVYTFAELLERGDTRAIEKAREWLAEAATEGDFWYESVFDMWEGALAQIGFTKAKIYFSGFYHQGSGATFESGIDKETLIEFLSTPVKPSEVIDTMANDPTKEDFRPYIVKNCGGVRFNRKFRRLLAVSDYVNMRNERIHHGFASDVTASAYRLTAELDYAHNETKRLLALAAELEEAAEELRADLCHAIYTSLRDEYEYRISDEALTEDAEANGYTFDRYGKREG